MAEDKDVYKTLMLGQEAYVASKFSQTNVRTIIQPVGSGGPIDPLDQYGKIGWKASVVSGVLNSNAIHMPAGPIEHDEIVEAILRWETYFR